MNNREKLFLVKAAQQFQNNYDVNDPASMREAYMNRGTDNHNMSYTPQASSVPGNFGFNNQKDFDQGAALMSKFRSKYGAGLLGGRGENSPWNGVSPQMEKQVMDMRRSVTGRTGAVDTEGLKRMDKIHAENDRNYKPRMPQFTAPETQTRYNGGQPGGSNYYHGLHHMNTDEFGDHTFSSAPRRTNANFHGEGGQEKFDQALSAYNDGVDNYNDYGSFEAPDNPPDLLTQRLQESGGSTNVAATPPPPPATPPLPGKATPPASPGQLNNPFANSPFPFGGSKPGLSTLPGTPIPPSTSLGSQPQMQTLPGTPVPVDQFK